jgi:two-component system, OmpR family, alkaline phosphatase synthesis response regulator PhoP
VHVTGEGKDRVARILLAEDEAGIALTIEDDLTLEGYEVEVVGDGIAAARRGRDGRFDLILLDVMLPGRNGFDVCRELRREHVTTPILLLTARAQESDKVMGLDLGADDYVTKPFSPHELRARVRALLRRTPGSSRPNRFAFADIEVDFARGEVCRGGRPLEMSALEFKLLQTFIEQRGRLLSRDQLLDQVWGHGVSVTQRVVDNQVLSLRKKIESDPADPRLLISVRGLGYRFDPDAAGAQA